MVKRLFAMIIVVAFLATALILPIYAATGSDWPNNELSRAIGFNLTIGQNTVNMGEAVVLQTGVPVFFLSNSTVTGFTSASVSFTIEAAATVWIGAYNNAGSWYPDPNYNVGTLSQYYDQSLSFEGTLTYAHRYTVSSSSGSIQATADSAVLSTYIACFYNVPAGTYTYTYNPSARFAPLAIFVDYIGDPPSGGGGGESGGGTTSPGGGGTAIEYPMGAARYTAWESLLNAINNFDGSSNSLQAVLSRLDEMSKWGDLLGVCMADYALNLLSERGGLTSGNIDGFISDAEDIIDQMIDYDITPMEAAVGLSSAFTEYLDKCATVSEALLLGSTYTAWNQKTLLIALFDDNDEDLVPGLSQEEQDKVDNYYQKEEELLAKFEQEQYSSYIDMQNYVNSMNVGSIKTMVGWLDYLINDSFFSPFIMMPLSLLLVTILLGTRIRIRSELKPERLDDRSRRK